MKDRTLQLLQDNNVELEDAQNIIRKILAKTKVKGEENLVKLFNDNNITIEDAAKIIIPFADPTLDVSFKMLFGQDNNKDILISLLNSLLNFKGNKLIVDVQINPSDLKVANVSNKKNDTGITSAVDILCTNTGKQQIAIEIQGQKKNYFLTREQEYMAKLIAGQVKEGQGQEYHEKVLDTYIIVIGKDNMFIGNTALKDQKMFEIDVEPKIVQTGEPYPGNKMHWKFFELPKFKASDQYQKIKGYDNIDSSDLIKVSEKAIWLNNNLKEQWLEFLIECNSQTIAPDRNNLIKKGYEIMKLTNWTPADQTLYWKQKQNEFDAVNQQKYDKEEAFNKGHKEGLEKGKWKGEYKGEIGKIKMGIEAEWSDEKILKKLNYTKENFLQFKNYFQQHPGRLEVEDNESSIMGDMNIEYQADF